MNNKYLVTFLFVSLFVIVFTSNGFASTNSFKKELIRANTILRQGDYWSARMVLIRAIKELPASEETRVKKLHRVIVLIQRQDEMAARTRLKSIIRTL